MNHRLRSGPGLIAIAAGGVLICLVGYWITAPTMDGLKAQGNGFVRVLERHREEHGRFPASAREAGLQLPETRYGSWRYRALEAGESCELAVGDYTGRNPFTLYWTSKSGHWSLDR